MHPHRPITGENNVRNAENYKLIFPKVVQQHYVCWCGWQINNFSVAHYLNTLCVEYCGNRSTYVITTVK